MSNCCQDQHCLYFQELLLIDRILNDPNEQIPWYDLRLIQRQLERQKDLDLINKRLAFLGERISEDRQFVHKHGINATDSQQKQRDLKYNLRREKQFMLDQRSLQKEIDRFSVYMSQDKQLKDWHAKVISNQLPAHMVHTLQLKIKNKELYND